MLLELIRVDLLIRVCLLDKDFNVFESARFDDKIEERTEGDYHEFEHVFKDYNEHVRYVFFVHGSQIWKGHFGFKLTNSEVKLIF